MTHRLTEILSESINPWWPPAGTESLNTISTGEWCAWGYPTSGGK